MSFYINTGFTVPRWVNTVIGFLTFSVCTNAFRCTDCGQTFPYGADVSEEDAAKHITAHVALMHPKEATPVICNKCGRPVAESLDAAPGDATIVCPCLWR